MTTDTSADLVEIVRIRIGRGGRTVATPIIRYGLLARVDAVAIVTAANAEKEVDGTLYQVRPVDVFADMGPGPLALA